MRQTFRLLKVEAFYNTSPEVSYIEKKLAQGEMSVDSPPSWSLTTMSYRNGTHVEENDFFCPMAKNHSSFDYEMLLRFMLPNDVLFLTNKYFDA